MAGQPWRGKSQFSELLRARSTVKQVREKRRELTARTRMVLIAFLSISL
jgi:hypothetical protein